MKCHLQNIYTNIIPEDLGPLSKSFNLLKSTTSKDVKL